MVEDGKYESLTEAPLPAVFWPAMQSYSATNVLIARSALPEQETGFRMRRALASLDPRLPVFGAGSLEQMLGVMFLPAQMATLALGAFGVLAMMLAITGIYGLAAYSVSRRVREIGIRTAVGARPAQVLRFVLGRTAVVVAAGSAIGLALGAGAATLLEHIVYQASARDPVILAAAALAMALLGIAAACAPARRALSIDPLSALRYE